MRLCVRFLRLCFCEDARCGRLQINLKACCKKIAKNTDQTPQKASTLYSSITNSTSFLVSPPRSRRQRSNSTSRRLDDLGQECVAERPHHRIIFMTIVNEWEVADEPHKNDDLRVSSDLGKFVTSQHASGQDTPAHRSVEGPVLLVFGCVDANPPSSPPSLPHTPVHTEQVVRSRPFSGSV